VVRPRLGGHGARRACADGPVQCGREGLVLVRRGGFVHRGELERAPPAVPELRPDARRDATGLDLARYRGAALHRHRARPHLPGDDRPGRVLPGDAHGLRRRDLGERAPRVLVQRGEVAQGRGAGRRGPGGRSAYEGEIMKRILAALVAGLMVGAIAAAHATLPPGPAKSADEKAAEARKAAAPGPNASNGPGADHAEEISPRHEPTREQEATAMPLPGQATGEL